MAKGKGILGWIIGMVAGTTLGVLFAPRKGKELRSSIKEARRRGKFGHEPVIEDMKHLGEEIMGVAKDAYEKSVLQDMVKKWKKELEELSIDLKEDTSDFHEESLKPAMKDAKRRARRLLHKAKAGHRIVKKAAAELQREIKKP